MYRTLPADAAAIVRAYPPMVVCFAAALTGTALVFDVFYLVASPGLALAAVYTVPVLAGLIAGLVAAADDLGLERRVLGWTIAAAVAVGISNIAVVAMVAAMMRTGPSDWGAGGRAVLLAACSALCFSVSIVVIGNLIGSLVSRLGVDIKTRFPVRKKAVQPPVTPVDPKPRASKEAAARAAKPARVEQPEPVEEISVVATLRPPPPRVVDLDEPRPVASWVEGTGHADRRAPRSRRGLAGPPSRHPNRPGRRPDR